MKSVLFAGIAELFIFYSSGMRGFIFGSAVVPVFAVSTLKYYY
jgi:hypothetical protein